MISVTEKENVKPLCPHCENEISEISAVRMKTLFGIRFVFFCSLCRKVLGVTHRKGFWMG